jgi:CelD/BcsL family acetyltransferase involved in cellulose biosynthesis
MRGPDRVLDLRDLSREDLDGWARLVLDGGHSYFAGPTWCRAWSEHLVPEARVEVALWDGAAGVAAVAPLARTAESVLPGRVGGRAEVPVWQNAGAGPGSADHLGFPAEAGLRTSTLRWALRRHGTVRLSHFDPSWALELAAAPGAVSEVRTYAADLTASARPGSKKLWKHIARSRRHLVGQGVHFDHLVGAEVDRDALASLFALHGVRSTAAGRRTTFTTARLDFHEQLALGSGPVGSTFLVRARASGVLVGALYGFVEPGRVSYYQSGWDPSLERYSLGSVLIGEAVELAVASGAHTFDFLRGDESYKLRFGAAVVADRSLERRRGPSGAVLAGRSLARSLVRRAATRRRSVASEATESPS